MLRCFQLAELGAERVAPNPMVGAVLVHQGRIIGEGWHQQYGKAHAEVNCVASVKPEDRPLIPESTLYVSLEPCTIHGNTPPCTSLIIREKIKKVVLSCTDGTLEVEGQSAGVLRAAGVEVVTGVLEEAGFWLARRRNVFTKQHRPYIVLKFARSADGFMSLQNERTQLTGPLTQRIVHRWRTEEAAIMVGSRTAIIDNPQLTNRFWGEKQPLRILLDRRGAVPANAQIFDESARTLVFGETMRTDLPTYVEQSILQPGQEPLEQIIQELVHRKIQSVLVEGGAELLKHFIQSNLWDEARILTATDKWLGQGVSAPSIQGKILFKEKIEKDEIRLITFSIDNLFN